MKSLSRIDNKENLSIQILLTIELMLKDLELNITDITKILYTNGPGSYTGIRIGQSVFQALGYALDAKVINITVLEALMFEADQTGEYLVAMLAGKEDIYWQEFIKKKKKIKKLSKIDSCKVSEFEEYLDIRNKKKVIVSHDLGTKLREINNTITVASDNVSIPSYQFYLSQLNSRNWTQNPPVYGREFLLGK
jgi:tRNA threonylcarbamoyl adenosine modification protein YeaZ